MVNRMIMQKYNDRNPGEKRQSSWATLAPLLLVFIVLSFDVEANGAPPWIQKKVHVVVQDQPLQQFLTRLFTASAIKVVLSAQIQGQVSGEFNAVPQKIFADLSKAYDLLAYFDGDRMYISTINEIETKSITVGKNQVDRVMKSLVTMDLSDRRQSIKVEADKGIIKVRGISAFVRDVSNTITSLSQPVKKALYRPKKTIVQAPTAPQPQKPQIIFKSFPLQYATAADVSYQQNGQEIIIPGVASLLKNMLGDSQSLRTSQIRASLPDNTLPGLRGKGLKTYPEHQQNHGSLRQAGLQVGIANEPVFSVSANAQSRANIVRVEADRNLNSVIVKGYADSMPVYADLIQQLDKEPQLVEIQVTIIDIDKNKLQDIGLDWRYQNDRTSTRFGGGNPVDSDGGLGGLLLNTVLGDSRRFFASIRALAENGSARVVSRPQVLTLSNLEAVLQNDQSFFVRVAGNEEVDLFNVSAGTSLRVVPQVVGGANERKIRLLVTIEDGTVVPGAVVDDIPVVENSSLSTQAIIYDGEDLLLGGLVRETTRKNDSKVPVLGDIPAVGNLFKRTSTTRARTERLFLISPRIVNNQRHHSRRQSKPINPDRLPIRRQNNADKLANGVEHYSDRQLLSSISPVYNDPVYYNERDRYSRKTNKIYNYQELQGSRRNSQYNREDRDVGHAR